MTQAKAEAIQLFRELDLPSPETFGERYPHQVSGGQLQRAMAAMAMSCHPDILVLDEPTTALDVTTQIEVLASIRKLIRVHHAAGLYISHDLAVVAQVANRIMVLRHGKMVEEGEADQILHRPRDGLHPRPGLDARGPMLGALGATAAGAAPVLELQSRDGELCQARQGRERHQPDRAQGRDRRRGRRIRQRQEHARPRHHGAAAARSGRYPLPGKLAAAGAGRSAAAIFCAASR